MYEEVLGSRKSSGSVFEIVFLLLTEENCWFFFRTIIDTKRKNILTAASRLSQKKG